MSVDTRMVLVDLVQGCDGPDGALYGKVVATVELCSISSASRTCALARRARESAERVYFFSDDGSTEVRLDGYGHRVGVADPAEFQAAMEYDTRRAGVGYRRFDMAIALLAKARHGFGTGLRVLVYEH